MTNLNSVDRWARRLRIAAATVLLAVAALARPLAADDDAMPVPANLRVPAGNTAYLIGHAYGTQNYVCLQSGSGYAWAFYGPQATLFDDTNLQMITHFLSPNPAEGGTLRATWQHSGDTSAAWAVAIASSTNPGFVAPGAIPWLLLRVVGTEYGPTLGGTLVQTTYVQRVNTAGGSAPAAGCSAASDVGKKAMVPYTTDYVFYRP